MESGRSAERDALALSFDDGPSEWTPSILDLLAEHSARATFFVLGSSIDGRERTLEQALEEGHELGLHGWTHRRLTELSAAEIENEMIETQAAIERATGVVTQVWRAPYLEADERVRRVLAGSGLVEAGCSIAPEDYRWPAERTAVFVIKRLQPEAILDLHDGRPECSGSDPTRLETVRALGLILSELDRLELRGIPVSELRARHA
ncbi:MAG: polysaccharide deacetylase family protein [Gaiellaceae bacterium]|jgi:peptidoglycan/xylan/chitin deacetylase (PgdA/CDA1 family)